MTVSLVLDGEFYWIKNIATDEISIGLCILKDVRQGAVFQEFGSSYRRHHSNYIVLEHICAPAILEQPTFELPEPGEPPLTDDEDWDDGEWEQDIYDVEDDVDDWDEDDWGEEEDD
jgi:hypothetical protein